MRTHRALQMRVRALWLYDWAGCCLDAHEGGSLARLSLSASLGHCLVKRAIHNSEALDNVPPHHITVCAGLVHAQP